MVGRIKKTWDYYYKKVLQFILKIKFIFIKYIQFESYDKLAKI